MENQDGKYQYEIDTSKHCMRQWICFLVQRYFSVVSDLPEYLDKRPVFRPNTKRNSACSCPKRAEVETIISVTRGKSISSVKQTSVENDRSA